MSEVAAPAPAAGASAPTPAPGNGAASEVQKPAAPPKPRMNNGQFGTKEGSQGVAPVGPPKPKEETTPPEYRFKKKLKVFGQEEDVDLGEEDIARELQKSRAYQRKEAEFRKEREALAAERAELEQLAKENPDELLKRLGHDTETLYRQRLAVQAREMAMSDEERAFHQLQQENEALKTEAKRREEEGKQLRARALKEHTKQESQKRMLAALDSSGLPRNHATLYEMSLVEAAALEDGIEYTPEELGKETDRRLGEYTARYVTGLPVEVAAKKLGAKFCEALVSHLLAEFEKSQPHYEEPKPQEEPPAAEPNSEPVSFDDVRKRLKAFGT